MNNLICSLVMFMRIYIKALHIHQIFLRLENHTTTYKATNQYPDPQIVLRVSILTVKNQENNPIMCPRCRDGGYNQQACGPCAGYGMKLSSLCASCNGTGRSSPRERQATGRLSCSSCNGAQGVRNVFCVSCSGGGLVIVYCSCV